MKIVYVTEPTSNGGIYRYTVDLVNAIGDRAETEIIPWDEYQNKIYLSLENGLVHYQHAYGYGEKIVYRFMSTPYPTITTLHEIPLWPHYNWYAEAKTNFVVGNEMMERELLKLGVSREKLTVIPHGATIWGAEDKIVARQKLGLNIPYKNIIVQPGFISWGKGISEVIYAVSKIPDTYLVFAGGVHPNATLQDKKYLLQCMRGAKSIGMENRVHFVGSFLSEKELELWMSAADILILNHQFVYGSYSASAMAKRILCAERPIIMSHDVRLSEYKHMEHCVKVVAEDVGQVESAIRTLINDKELGQKLASNARDYAEKYSWHNMATRHLELYEKIINDNN